MLKTISFLNERFGEMRAKEKLYVEKNPALQALHPISCSNQVSFQQFNGGMQFENIQ